MEFYDELIKNIKLDIKSGNDKKALTTIDEELSMPYIPQDIEKKLLELKESLKIEDKKNKNLSLEEIVIFLNSSNNENQSLALDYLKNINLRSILLELSEYLKNPKNKNQFKSFVIMSMNNQKIDEQLILNKNNINYEINPYKINNTKMNIQIDKIQKIINDTIGVENPIIAKIAFENVFYDFLNEYPFFSIEDTSSYIAANLLIASISLGDEIELDKLKKWFIFDEQKFLEYKKQITELLKN